MSNMHARVETSEVENVYVLFDGECIMCNKLIATIDQAGIKKYVRISATSSAQRFADISNIIISLEEIERLAKRTLILKSSTKMEFKTKSRAISSLLNCTRSRNLRLTASLIDLVPIEVADFVYDLVSKARMRFPTKSCALGLMKSIRIYE